MRRSSAGRVLRCAFGLGFGFATAANAERVEVLWSADVVAGAMGAGNLSGSFGVFDVDHVGQAFLIPKDGSAPVTSSGFTSGFPNDDGAFRGGPRAFMLFQFTSLVPYRGKVVFYSPPFNGVDPYWYSAELSPCQVPGFQKCTAQLGMFSVTDMMAAGWDSGGGLLLSGGPIQFSFAVEDTSVPAARLFARAAIVGGVLAAAGAAQRWRRHST